MPYTNPGAMDVIQANRRDAERDAELANTRAQEQDLRFRLAEVSNSAHDLAAQVAGLRAQVAGLQAQVAALEWEASFQEERAEWFNTCRAKAQTRESQRKKQLRAAHQAEEEQRERANDLDCRIQKLKSERKELRRLLAASQNAQRQGCSTTAKKGPKRRRDHDEDPEGPAGSAGGPAKRVPV